MLVAVLAAVTGVVPLTYFAGLPVLPALLLCVGTGVVIGLLAYLICGREGRFEGVVLLLEILGCFFG